MSKIYKQKIRIRFREADPARIMYFAHLVSLAHDVFEDFIQTTGLTWQDWFQKNTHMIPIRHVEVDYRAPFIPGDEYQVEVVVESFGKTSFKMKYTFTRQKTVHGMVRMVHSVLDKKSLQKSDLPEFIFKHLGPYLEKKSHE